MAQISIVGYEQDCNCEHCGRKLRHGIRINDGRVVGATCMDKKLTKAKTYQGKPYRVGSEKIVHYAKVAQFCSSDAWGRYGVNDKALTFESAH